ncbi:MAG TPA: hypothetical protein VN540_02290 [Clostridia bacterium]|nr:hypothetical protein [Clostridia bacterium]
MFFSCAALCALLIAFNRESAGAAREGFALWQNVLLPSLLPFFVCARIMQASGAVQPSDPVALFALSFVSGAPSGARLCAAFEPGEDSPYGPTLVAASLNTLSPVFVCGTYASVILGAPVLAIPLIMGQLVSALAFFGFFLRTGALDIKKHKAFEPVPASKLFPSAIADAVSSLLGICGTVVFFSVLETVLDTAGVTRVLTWPARMLVDALGGKGASVEAVLSALLEVASGANEIARSGMGLRAAVTVSAFAFTFGGLCVAVQSMLFMRIDLGRYILVKFAQASLSALIAFLVFPLCAKGIVPVGVSLDEVLGNALSACAIFAVSLFGMGFVLLLCAARRRRGLRQSAGTRDS